jgi:hypothetical protein
MDLAEHPCPGSDFPVCFLKKKNSDSKFKNSQMGPAPDPVSECLFDHFLPFISLFLAAIQWSIRPKRDPKR